MNRAPPFASPTPPVDLGSLRHNSRECCVAQSLQKTINLERPPPLSEAEGAPAGIPNDDTTPPPRDRRGGSFTIHLMGEEAQDYFGISLPRITPSIAARRLNRDLWRRNSLECCESFIVAKHIRSGGTNHCDHLNRSTTLLVQIHYQSTS
ncbi:hypothetical protein CDAR_598261 [Caerostris darwini]|uniref:Uncharacterized protein n=1 Tax=Caerostris darwini TaxID=1538125 RepID=A0AAV4QL76_9ARAC|nr:hypothetical protein CDAR_598261 [Caerostris darwini]